MRRNDIESHAARHSAATTIMAQLMAADRAAFGDPSKRVAEVERLAALAYDAAAALVREGDKRDKASETD